MISNSLEIINHDNEIELSYVNNVNPADLEVAIFSFLFFKYDLAVNFVLFKYKVFSTRIFGDLYESGIY